MNFSEFESRTAASVAAAEFMTGALRSSLAKHACASVLISGGSTPCECLAVLSRSPLDWSRISISSTDERCVPVSHDASNERMIREHLITNEASDAAFEPLQNFVTTKFAEQLSCCLVGMGEDGHFASVFPDNERLSELVDLNAPPASVEIKTTASEYERVTANLSLLLSGESVLVLAFGEKKKSLLLYPDEFPVAHLLKQDKTPVEVYWSK